MGRWIGGEADETEGLFPPRGPEALPLHRFAVPLPIRERERGGDLESWRCAGNPGNYSRIARKTGRDFNHIAFSQACLPA